jgi:hypothetical protein
VHGVASGRLSSTPTRSVRGLPAVLAIVALIAACAGPAPSGPAPTGSAAASATPGPSSGNAATTPDPRRSADWARVTMADVPQTVSLEATRSGPGGVAVDTAFRLTTSDGRAAATLAPLLQSEPAIAFTVASTDGATALVRPSQPFQAGTLYRISLARPDGSIEATWAAQAAAPLEIVETIPADGATGVPLNTGIELKFNQAGVSPAALDKHFSISPTAAGRFEASGRTVAFIPTKPLAKGRLYTVTVARGLPLEGTGQVMARSVVVRFETAAAARSAVGVSLPRPFTEASPREKAAISLALEVPDGTTAPTRIPVSVHRLAGQQAAINAWRAIMVAPEWTRVSTTPAVPVSGLRRLVNANLPVQTNSNGISWVQLPKSLTAGWYLVTETWAGVPRQTVLQVTDLSTFSMLGIGKSAVWVNDLATGRAVAGALVAVDGHRLGATDKRGLLVATTPRGLKLGPGPTSSPILVVRSGSSSAFQPYLAGQYCSGCASSSVQDTWWRLFASDRSRFRSTDTINAWGVVRNRNSGTVPSSVVVSLRPAPDQAGAATPTPTPAIATLSVSPDANGAFSIRMPVRDLPVGSYRLVLSSRADTLGELWLDVATIVKPAFRLGLTTDRHAVVNGAAVTGSVDAAFFDGTPVAGTELSLALSDTAPTAKASTDAAGHASGPVAVRLANAEDQWGVTSVQAVPTLPEEAEVTASSDVAVFRATALVDVGAALAGTRLAITGKVSDVAFGRFETAPPSGLAEVDPRGSGRAGASVRVQVIEHTPARHQTGTSYDFILKRVAPVYETSDRTTTVLTQTVHTAPDGTFALSPAVKGGNHSYEVRATYTDEGQRQTTGTASAETRSQGDGRGAWLEAADAAHPTAEYSVGEAVRVRFRGGLEGAPVSRYFFAVAHGGLTYATVGGSPAFRTTFTAASVPSMSITAVRFNGHGYDLAVSSYAASLRLADRTLSVRVDPDKARYAPGDTANLTIRTAGPDGRPVAASVYVQAVDEKLYAIGAAAQVDPLGELYGDLGDGIIAWAASHRTPGDDEGKGGGGDTTGGGGDGRSNFQDWLVATMVRTDSSGTARLAVPLSSDLTSWHVSAAAVDAALEAGTGTAFLPVGLPFFVDATVAPSYLVADRPIIRVRGFGGGLVAGERVTFTVSSDTLPMSPTTATADAFQAAEVPLPQLTEGRHRIRIAATAGTGSAPSSDVLIRTFDVVATRATRRITNWVALGGPTAVATGTGLTRVMLVDAGRGRVVPLLQDLAATGDGRSDRVLAAGLANLVLSGQFGVPAPANTSETDIERFVADGALAIVPYGSADVEVSAMAGMARDPRLDAAALASWLRQVADPAAGHVRDERLQALAGLAGLGEPVLADVREAARQPDLTIPEQISVALAALYAGDEALARSIEHSVLSARGMRLGPWVRVDPGANADPGVETARLAIVAASLGDPVAADMDAWVAANPPTATTVDLERALAARGWARRVAGASAVAAVTVDGVRREVSIEPGAPVSIDLTPAQAATARLEPVRGSVLAVTTSDGPLGEAALTPAMDQQVVRLVSPTGVVGPRDTVVVTLQVTLGPDARDECWRLTDLVPSGLAPISGGTWVTDSDGNKTRNGTSPDVVDGQRVAFCVVRDPKQPVQTMRYAARVVTPGTYAWEPAVLQSEVVPNQGVVIQPATVTIRGSGG